MAPATKEATPAKSRTRQPKTMTNSQVSSTQHIIPFSQEYAAYQLRDIPLSQITISEGHREPKNVEDLAESIAHLGLMHPITVVAHGGEQYRCLAGANRIAACHTLGWTHIPAHIVDFAGLQAEMAMIDENLMRNELTDLELAEQLYRRKAIYETLHEETKHGGNRRQDPDSGSCPRVPAFLDNAARITGRGRTTIGDYVQIAKHLDPEVKATLRHTPMANRKTDLLTLAKMKPEAQRTLAKTIVEEHSPSVAKVVHTLQQKKREEDIQKQTQHVDAYQKIFPLLDVYAKELAAKEGLQIATNFTMANAHEGWINIRLVKNGMREPNG
jgi:ParB family chromosome partitioning protein